LFKPAGKDVVLVIDFKTTFTKLTKSKNAAVLSKRLMEASKLRLVKHIPG